MLPPFGIRAGFNGPLIFMSHQCQVAEARKSGTASTSTGGTEFAYSFYSNHLLCYIGRRSSLIRYHGVRQLGQRRFDRLRETRDPRMLPDGSKTNHRPAASWELLIMNR